MIDRLRSRLNAALDRRRSAAQTVATEEDALAEAEAEVKACLRARQLVQDVAETVQTVAHRRIASVVTRCLRTVFGEDAPEFRIRFEQKRGRTEASLLFVRGDNEVDPTASEGGGFVEVAAFALRLACLMMARPKRRRLLVLDEPFHFVSREYRDNIRNLLLGIAEEMQVQIVMVTHIDELALGTVYRFDR